MADDVRTLLLQIDATTQLLRSNLAQAEAAVADFQRDTDRKLDQVDSKFAGLGKGLGSLKSQLMSVTAVASTFLAALGVGAGVSGIVSLARDALDYASSLGETAQQLGVTAEQLQVYRYAATQVGISQEEMDKGLGKLTRTLGDAQTGSKSAAKVFDALGISLTNADGSARTAGDALPLIADALAQIEEPAKRAAVEVDLFGRTGQKLDTLLAGGSAEINNLRNAAHDLGIVLSDSQIQNADATADKLAELKSVLEANIAGVVADNATEIYRLADSLIHLVAAIPDAIVAWRRWRIENGIRFEDALQRLPLDSKFRQDSEAREARDRARLSAMDAIGDDVMVQRLGIGRGGLNGIRGSRPAAAPRPRGLDTLNASPGRGGNKDVDEVQKQIDALQRSAREAIDTIHILTRDEENRQLAQKTKWFSNDDFDNIVKEIDRRRDAEFRLIEERKEQEAELARLREQSIYDLAGLYEDLFRGGTSALWRDFKALGLRAVAEVMARLTAGDSFNAAIGAVFGRGGNGAGSTLAGLFSLGGGSDFNFGGLFGGRTPGSTPPIYGGARAGGGPVDAGKAYLVGERRAEIFVPRMPGTIIPSTAGLGGGTTISMPIHIDATGADAAGIARVEQQLAVMQARLPGQIVATMRDARTRNIGGI